MNGLEIAGLAVGSSIGYLLVGALVAGICLAVFADEEVKPNDSLEEIARTYFQEEAWVLVLLFWPLVFPFMFIGGVIIGAVYLASWVGRKITKLMMPKPENNPETVGF